MLHRRDILNGALWSTAVAALPPADLVQAANSEPGRRPWRIIDTNLDLFQWPFRRLPFDTTTELVAKLRSLNIDQAWAGSYEGLLQRDIAGVNLRLANACRTHGAGLLIPIGSVNVMLPDWQEDLRRCHEDHRMPAIRLHPNYHGYALDDPKFSQLLQLAQSRQLLVQLAVSMQDPRTQHPLLRVPDVDLTALPELVTKFPGVRIVLLNYKPRGALFTRLAATAGVYFDVARVEGTDGISRLVRSVPADRVVFGTHAPFFIYESALIRVYESNLTEAESRAVFEQNASRLIAVE